MPSASGGSPSDLAPRSNASQGSMSNGVEESHRTSSRLNEKRSTDSLQPFAGSTSGLSAIAGSPTTGGNRVLRRPISTEIFRPSTLRPSSSASSKSSSSSSIVTADSAGASTSSTSSVRRYSGAHLRKPTAERLWEEPTLQELMRLEVEKERVRETEAKAQQSSSAVIASRTSNENNGHVSKTVTGDLRDGVNGHHFDSRSFNRKVESNGKQRAKEDSSNRGIGYENHVKGEEAGENGIINKSMVENGTGRHLWENDVPESAMLYPPLYGRPAPPPSPDLFAALLQPLLNLSRPPSPAVTPPPSHPSSRRNSAIFTSPHTGFLSLPYVATAPVTNGLLVEEPKSFPMSSDHLTAFSMKDATSDTLSSSPLDRSSSSLPAHFPPRTPSDPAPTVESQGFVLYLSSLVVWISYLVWGFCKDDWLERMGILWFPSREWALLVPAWSIMLAAFVYFSYVALNIYITPNLDSLHVLTDNQAYILDPGSIIVSTNDLARSQREGIIKLPNGFRRSINCKATAHPLLANSVFLPPDAVPPLHDLPIGLVNRVVFGDFRRKRKTLQDAAANSTCSMNAMGSSAGNSSSDRIT